jgi:hypothetical protein
MRGADASYVDTPGASPSRPAAGGDGASEWHKLYCGEGTAGVMESGTNYRRGLNN